MKTIEDLDQREFDAVKAAHEKLDERQRDALDAISRGFGKMLSNMYWPEHAALESIGVARLKQSRFRFHDVEITPLGLHVIDYHASLSAE